MGEFFPRPLNFFSNPKGLSLESVLLACKKLLPSEQVFLIEKFCLNVAENAKCWNPAFWNKLETVFQWQKKNEENYRFPCVSRICCSSAKILTIPKKKGNRVEYLVFMDSRLFLFRPLFSQSHTPPHCGKNKKQTTKQQVVWRWTEAVSKFLQVQTPGGN